MIANRTKTGLKESTDYLLSILSTERFSTQEILQLFNYYCFPSNEISFIRKDMKSLKEVQSKFLDSYGVTENNDSSENILQGYGSLVIMIQEEKRLVERKLVYLTNRHKQEQESRQKKMVRANKLQDGIMLNHDKK